MGKNSFPVYIPLEEAAQRYGLDISDLEEAIERGLVRAVFAAENGHGKLLVSEEDVAFTSRLPYFPNVEPEICFLSLSEVAKQYNLDGQTLIDSLQSGIIEAARGAEGGLCVSEKLTSVGSQKEAILLARETRLSTRHLDGIPIHLSQAARKYGVPQSTLSRWVQRGYIRKVGQEKNRILLNEGDVAYCVNVYRSMRGKRGKRIFQKGGLPYVPKHKRRKEPQPDAA